MDSRANASEEPSEPQNPHNLSAGAYRRLRKLIVTGQLAPGSRVIESNVAERLGVSRTPVRAALQRLEQEGYIVSDDGGGRWRPTVAPLTKEDARELLYIIGQIESLAAWFAARLEGEDEHQRLVRTLHDINDQLKAEARVSRRASEHYFDLDERFHRTYVELAGGPRLRSLHEATKPQAERYIRVYVSALITEIDTSIAEHEDILQAIERRDASAAQRAVEANWRGAADRLERVIDWVGERGRW